MHNSYVRPYPLSIDHRIVIDGIGGIGKSSLALEVAYRCLQASLQKAKPGEQDYLINLRQMLERRFSEEELRTLCFDLALDYDMLPAQGKAGKARELVAYLERRNRLPELTEVIKCVRPDIEDRDLFTTFLPESSQAESFKAIIWISAKRTVLTGEGIISRHQTTGTLHDIYRAIAVTLEREDILRARSEEQSDIVRQALTRQRTLLILDNLETIDDETVMSFLQELPAPTKVLITTRHRISTAVPVRLSGMTWKDAQNLIQRECARKQVALSTREARLLYDRTGGLPLAIIWSIAQIGFGYDIQNVLTRLGTPTNDVVRFCFEGTVERLRIRPAHRLLLACAIFSNDVGREGLGYTASLPLLDQEDGLVELERLSLVNKKADRFSLLPLTRVFALDELEKHPDLNRQIRRRWLDYLKELCQQPVGEYYWRYLSHEFYREGNNLLEALEWVGDYGNVDDLFLLSRAAYDHLEVTGDWNSIFRHCTYALHMAQSVQRPLDIARFANVLGWVSYQQGDYDKAGQLYEMALVHYRQSGNQEGMAISLQHQSSLFRKLKAFDQAQALNDQAWQIAVDLDDGDLKALIETNYGKLARDMGDWERSWQYLTNVRDYFENRVAESPRDEPLARSTWGHLAIAAVHLGHPQQAKEYCLRSIEYFESRGTKGYLATLKYRLALAEQALGEHETASQHLQEAMEWFDRLGMKPDYAEAQKVQRELAQHIQV